MLNRRGARSTLIGITILLLFASVATAEDYATTEASKELVATAPPQPRRSLRLPNATYPLHYHLHFSSNIHRIDFSYGANVTIDIQIRESTNEIVLHAKQLGNLTITVRELTTGELMDDLTHSYDPHGSFLIIHPLEDYQAFEAGQQFRVEILYTAPMNERTRGIYWLTYSDAYNRTVYLAATQFEPTYARLAFPCYDEPALKANFTISLTHSSTYHAISNMHVQEVINHGTDNQLSTTKFHTTPPISTYLVAFVISDFKHISKENRGVTQRIFTAPNSSDRGIKALNNAVRTVAALEDYFGISYPLQKLDHIALKKNYGAAMENWGLITYKEDNLVSQDDQADMHKKLKDLLTQNHEIAHQWFGNLVSPEWWTYAWLNEGFATYFGYLVTDLLYPEYKTMEFFLTDIAERAYSYSYITVRPMTHYVETEMEIMSIFDIISYQRAACVIKMFHHAFNQKTFVNGISRFLRKFQYMAANELQLFDSLQAAIAEDTTLQRQDWSNSVREIMLSWTHSEWIPIVQISRNYEENTITIRQRSKDSHSGEYWWIPLNFATSSSSDFQRTHVDYFMPAVPEVTLSAHDLRIQLNRDDWLIANKQQTGFYHVLYDETNLMAIAMQLQRNHTEIHPLNRAAIFQDLCPLIENNELQSIDVIFELLKYLRYERDLIPWNLVADTVEFFGKNLNGTDALELYKQFVRQLIGPMFRELFQTPHHANLTNSEILARQKVMDMACMADLQECLVYTQALAYDYIFRNVKFGVDMDYYAMHDSILCLGVKYLSDDHFSAILDLLARSERNSLWYDDLIYSLRCTQSPQHLSQFLNVLLGENSTHIIMNDSESMMYLFYLYKSNLAARPVVWRFFELNYKILCRSPFFIENFNRVAEYIPLWHKKEFIRLRNFIAADCSSANSVENSVTLIDADSNRIGKKVKISEKFREKFAVPIHDWLLHDQMPSTYAASIGARNSASRIGYAFRLAEKITQKLYLLKW